MKQMENKVGFKSVPMFWSPEKRGTKPNTIRWVSEAETDWFRDNPPDFIEIENTETGEAFERGISYYLVVGKMLGRTCVMISWYHEEEETL